jgi:hypothetical protein
VRVCVCVCIHIHARAPAHTYFILNSKLDILNFDELQVEEEMLMRKFYDLMAAQGLSKKVFCFCYLIINLPLLFLYNLYQLIFVRLGLVIRSKPML